MEDSGPWNEEGIKDGQDRSRQDEKTAMSKINFR